MPKLSRWTINHLLPLLEEAATPLLPLRFQIKEEAEGHGLLWGGERIAVFSFAEDLPREEWQKWGPTVLALLNEIFGRLVREKTLYGLPGKDLLRRKLENGPLKGLLLKGASPPASEGLYALGRGLFFLPEGYFRPREVLKGLWQEGLSFHAAAIELHSPEELPFLPRFMDFLEAFGFLWFTGKAARYFAELGLVEEKWKPLAKLSSLAGTHSLAWVEGEPPSLNCLKEKARFFVELGERSLLLATPLPPEELEALFSSLSLRGGILPPSETKTPLRSIWAAFEHAKRLGGEAVVRFVPFSLHVLGDVFLDLGDLFAALSAYEEAKEGTLQPIELLNSLAYIYLELEDFEKAEAHLRKALSLAPEDPMLSYNLALFLEQQGREEEALSLFEKAHRLSPGEGPFAEALAERLAKKARWPEVKEILTGKEDSSGRRAFLLAKALYETGELEESLRLFKEVSQKDPQNLEALAYLALLYIQLRGEYSVAEAVLPQIEKSAAYAELANHLRTFLEGES